MPDAAPLVLGFDTSAAHCAAAVVSGGGVLGDGAGVQVLASRTLPMTRGQAEALMPLLEAVLREALAPPPPPRRKTKPTRGSVRRRREAKMRRSELKSTRKRPQIP